LSNCNKTVIFFAAICGTLLAVPPGTATEAYKGFKLDFYPQSKPKRVLPFTRNFSLGEILLADSPDQEVDTMLKGAARGTITVPPGKFVTFVPSHHFFEDPERGKVIPADGLDCLKVAVASMDDAEDGWCDRAMGYAGRFKSLIKLDLDRSDCTDKGLSHAGDLPNLQAISAFAAMIEGDCFKQLNKLKKLRFLFLQDNPIKQENLRYLETLPQLQYLYLGGTSIDDEGVRLISKCSQLVRLDLGGNRKITNLSVKYLLGLKNLRVLVLSGTSITSDGVLQLSTLPLVFLNLPGGRYTKEQIKAFHEAFPVAFPEGYPAASMVPSKETHKVDSDTRFLLGPLH
jgi:hypothetical protein